MFSMADKLVEAGIVTKDEARVAVQLKEDIEEVERELRRLRKLGAKSEKERKKVQFLKSRLRILKKTKVAK